MKPIPNRHITDLRLSHLRILKSLLTERSLTRTAQALGTTQPVVSKVLFKLRRELGDPLFVRIGLSMEPTAKARALAGPIDRILTAAHALQPDPPEFNPSTSGRTFRILISDSGVIRLLPLLMARLASEAPHLCLVAVPIDSYKLLPRLESGDVDLAVGSFPTLERGIRRRRLYTEGYLSLVRRDHPQLDRIHLRKVFVSQRHVLVEGSSTGHAGHQIAAKALDEAIAAKYVTLRVTSFISAALVAKRTNAIATMPAKLASLISTELGLQVFAPPIEIPQMEIAQYWHDRCDREPCNRWIRSLLVEVSRL